MWASSGSSSATDSTRSHSLWPPTNMTVNPESEAMWLICSGVEVAYRGTGTARTVAAPKSISDHSGRLPRKMPMRPPVSTSKSSSPCATRLSLVRNWE